ncbi:MAG: hypothetical protein LQ352_000899 [Teloschistes flavicans]|nr:MAG: hypothetical protein LQ352_000899 [Teloschistes flavicans]
MDVVAAGPNQDVALAPGKGSIVAGLPAEPYYLGLLGLRPTSSSRFNNSSPSFLTHLRSSNLIPSLSFGYTAGASYRKSTISPSWILSLTWKQGAQGVNGSLTLGGYDRSRFISNNITFQISDDGHSALRASVLSVSASNTLVGDVDLLSRNITALVTSDLPYLTLPDTVCKQFEIAFGLSWDSSRELYLVNDTAHGQLRSSNPSIVFSLGQSTAQSVNITVPYQAFDLQVTQPIAENGTNYFPLRCSSNATQYTLGRSFLQEAYLLVDYDQFSFSLSQAQFNNHSDIVTVDHAGGGPATNAATAHPAKASLSHGAIAGIAIGSSVALVLFLSLVFFLLRRFRRRRQTETIDPADISGPFPCEGEKDSWPHSPSASGEDSNVPPNAAISNSESPLQRFEERLERLERANTTRLPQSTETWDGEHRLRGEVSGEAMMTRMPPMIVETTSEHPKQELAGSPTAKELQDARFSHRAQAKASRHVFELAADDSRRTKSKR